MEFAKNCFKKGLNASMFTILSKEGYVDVSIIIKLYNYNLILN